MLALRVNTYTWKSTFNSYIDKKLTKVGVDLIDIPWEKCTLIKNDPDHFTWKGFKSFCKYLNREIKKKTPSGAKIHIIGDSTIDYHNYNKNYRYTGLANKYLKLYLRDREVTIDVQCGSGFHSPTSFITRCSKVSKHSTILFVGGWNDYSYEKIRKNINNLHSTGVLSS